MDVREQKIQSWFSMWLKRDPKGMDDLFSKDSVYVESWGPRYEGLAKIKLWFTEWNQRGKVTQWDIHHYFHREKETVVTWTFSCVMLDGSREHFDGVSLIRWSSDRKIVFLQEFGCAADQYDPYRDGPTPVFKKNEGESLSS